MTDNRDLRNWTVNDLLAVTRAAGILWYSTSQDDPYDVLNDHQRTLLDLAAISYLPASQGDTPDPDDEPDEDDEAPPQSWDGWVTLDRDRYYIMLEGLRAGPELGVPRREIAIYELAKAMADRGSFPAAWITGEHGPAAMSIDDEVRAWHDAGGDKLLPLTGVRYGRGTEVMAGNLVPWVVDADFGNMGVLLYAPGDPTVTMVADHGQLTPVPEPVQAGDAEGTERELAGESRCAHQTGYGLPWTEYCGIPLPCPLHPEG